MMPGTKTKSVLAAAGIEVGQDFNSLTSVKLALLVLLILVGYRAIWFVVETDPPTNLVKKGAILLAIVFALAAFCCAGKLLVDII